MILEQPENFEDFTHLLHQEITRKEKEWVTANCPDCEDFFALLFEKSDIQHNISYLIDKISNPQTLKETQQALKIELDEHLDELTQINRSIHDAKIAKEDKRALGDMETRFNEYRSHLHQKVAPNIHTQSKN